MNDSFFNLHGVGLQITSDHPPSTYAMLDRLHPYVRKHLADPDLFISIKQANQWTRTWAKKIPQTLRWIRSRPLWGDIQEETLRITDGESVALINYANRKADLQISETTANEQMFLARTFLLLPVIELMRAKEFYYLHAGFFTLGSHAILLLGQGGSGKSTLCAAAMQSGGQVIADDNVLLHGPTGKVYPLEQELSLSDEAIRQFPAMKRGATHQGKHRIPLHDLPEATRTISANPTDIFLLEWASPTGFSSASPTDIFRILAEENPLLLAQTYLAPNHTAALQKMIRSCRLARFRKSRTVPLQVDNLSLQFFQPFRDCPGDSSIAIIE